MKKIFISATELLQDSFRLAAQVLESGFAPDIVVGVWRGGAPVAIAIQEYFDYVGLPTEHSVIIASSYLGIGHQGDRIQVGGLEHLITHLSRETSVLLVDDVFDSGRSMQAILSELESKLSTNFPECVCIACPWYKPARNRTERIPDFFLHETDDWLVFPHELSGLSPQELREHKTELYALAELFE